MHKPKFQAIGVLTLLGVLLIAGIKPANAQLYWDTDSYVHGATSTNTAVGTWGLDNYWTTSIVGGKPSQTWQPGEKAVFSAGTDASGTFTINVFGTQITSGLDFQDGNITLQQGKLMLTNVGGGDATVTVALTKMATIASEIGGSSGLVKDGGGTLVLRGTNSYSGVTDLKDGTLLINNNLGLGTSSLNLNGGTFGATGSGVIINAPVSLSADSIIGGTENLTFSGNFTQRGGSRTLTFANPATTTFSGSTFVLSDDNHTRTLTLDVQNGPVTIGNSIQDGPGTGRITKQGSGRLTLTGNNTFSGGVNLNAGTLALGSDTALGTGGLTFGGSTRIEAFGGTRTIANALTFNGDVTFGGTDTLIFQSTFDLGGNRIFTVENTTIFNGVITGNNDSLTKRGNGNLILNGNNTFGSATDFLSVDAGTVTFGHNNAGGTTGTKLILNGGAVAAGGGARTLASPVILSNNSSIVGSQNLTFSGTFANMTASHTLNVSNSALTTFSGSTFTLAGSSTPATVTLNVAGTSGGMVINDTIVNGVGTGSLAKNGTGSLTLGGPAANTFSGGFTINAGTVTAAKVNALGTGPTTLNSATLDVASFSQTVSQFTLNGGTVNGTSGQISSVDFQMRSGTVNARLAGSGLLRKTTTGTVTLNTANTYTGGTIIDAGTLVVRNSSGSGTGTGTVTVNNGGTLSGNGSISGNIIVNNGGTISPGFGVGTLNTANEQWNGGSILLVEMKDADAGQGVGWDFLHVAGTLTVTATPANPIQVSLRSLTLGGTPGLVNDFSSMVSNSWRIVTADSGIVLNPGETPSTVFHVMLDEFSNSLGGGTFTLALANGNKDLILNFTPIPEPKTSHMIFMGFFLLVIGRRWMRAPFKGQTRTRPVIAPKQPPADEGFVVPRVVQPS